MNKFRILFASVFLITPCFSVNSSNDLENNEKKTVKKISSTLTKTSSSISKKRPIKDKKTRKNNLKKNLTHVAYINKDVEEFYEKFNKNLNDGEKRVLIKNKKSEDIFYTLQKKGFSQCVVAYALSLPSHASFNTIFALVKKNYSIYQEKVTNEIMECLKLKSKLFPENNIIENTTLETIPENSKNINNNINNITISSSRNDIELSADEKYLAGLLTRLQTDNPNRSSSFEPFSNLQTSSHTQEQAQNHFQENLYHFSYHGGYLFEQNASREHSDKEKNEEDTNNNIFENTEIMHGIELDEAQACLFFEDKDKDKDKGKEKDSVFDKNAFDISSLFSDTGFEINNNNPFTSPLELLPSVTKDAFMKELTLCKNKMEKLEISDFSDFLHIFTGSFLDEKLLTVLHHIENGNEEIFTQDCQKVHELYALLASLNK
jgi:hypothetical protein